MKDKNFMPINETIIQHENVNGVQLCLVVGTKNDIPRSRIFTISYKPEKPRRAWSCSKNHFILATLLHCFALSFVRINITVTLAIFISFASIAYFWVTHTVQSETALVIPSVGIQSTVKYVFGRKDNFIPWSSVDDVIINEVVRMSRVLYQLTVLVKPPNKNDDLMLVPLFKHTKPRLMMLEKIYAELQILLLESQRQELSMASGDQG